MKKVRIRTGCGKRITVPKNFLPNKHNRETQGHCYQEALEYVYEHFNIPGIMLVHGKYTERPRGHAWAQVTKDLVFDGVKQKFYFLKSYKKMFKAVERVRYTPMEAIKLSDKNLDTGPWEKIAWNGLYLGHEGTRMPGCLTPMWGFGSRKQQKMRKQFYLKSIQNDE